MASQIFNELGNYRDSALYEAYAEGVRITIEVRPIQETYLNFLAAESVKNAEIYADILQDYVDGFVGTYQETNTVFENYIIINEDLEVGRSYIPEDYDAISYSFILVGELNRISKNMSELGIAYNWTVDDECEVVYCFEFSSTFDYFKSTYSETQSSGYYEQITEEEYLIAVEAVK